MLPHANFPPSLSCLTYTRAMKTPANSKDTLFSQMVGHKLPILQYHRYCSGSREHPTLKTGFLSKCLGRFLVHSILESTSQQAEVNHFWHFNLFWVFRVASVACLDTHSSAQRGPRAASPPHAASKSFSSRTCSDSPNKVAQRPLVL